MVCAEESLFPVFPPRAKYPLCNHEGRVAEAKQNPSHASTFTVQARSGTAKEA